ncbi:ankyrin repeat protein [Caballeronia udeis]|uniref:Ankyrin repeat protein n=1 Tax=Caballeronia udeis TaxID=1232866 RepID=A0ABW8MX81_9BURK
MNQADADLIAAVKILDRQKAEDAINGGANVNVVDSKGTTPLHWLCHFVPGHYRIEAVRLGPVVSDSDVLGILDLLLKKGANVNAGRTGTAVTPLHLLVLDAVPFACIEPLVTRLLAAGADINAKTNKGHTPLTVAKVAQEKAGNIDSLTTVASLQKLGAVSSEP